MLPQIGPAACARRLLTVTRPPSSVRPQAPHDARLPPLAALLADLTSLCGHRHDRQRPGPRAALLAGKHVLAQKLIRRNPPELEAIDATAAAAPDLRLAVNFNGRWAPPWVSVRARSSATVSSAKLRDHALHDIRISWPPDPNAWIGVVPARLHDSLGRHQSGVAGTRGAAFSDAVSRVADDDARR
jgi:hypothetical protein